MSLKHRTIVTSLSSLKGVGPAVEKHLARLEIHAPQDLLFHLPLRYQDRTQIEPMRAVIPGNEAVVEGVIHSIEQPPRGRTKLLCELRDETGRMQLRFFHVLPFQVDILKPGTRLRCYSSVRLGPKGMEMTHPEFQVIVEGKEPPLEQYLTPIYPATEGLSQYMLRKITQSALTWMETHTALKELLPESLLKTYQWPTLQAAIRFVHRPPREVQNAIHENKTPAQLRLVFEELLAHRLSLLRLKGEFQSKAAVPLVARETYLPAFREKLPYALTAAQERVVNEIHADLSKPFPMLRLVQGDVGSGKTVVAALSMLRAIENGYQAALMAPTELLAEQHCRVFKQWFEPMGLKVVFFSGEVKGRARKETLEMIKQGDAQIIIGTHALFQQEVEYAKLALVIVDEQHRFGVHQRALFRGKGETELCFPHQLIMTATPIPRTLAMSFYADLDSSVIDELPPGRTPIVTTVIANTRREEMIERIREACHSGRQTYWVCSLIEESEVIACQAATQLAEELRVLLPELVIGLVHGKMKSKEKEEVMREFQQGRMHLLVATTVIEVGVDVPNASLMVIENAERLGLSQLHQLRGRVGRGSVASHCVLVYQAPLSRLARERLSVMRETGDGFKIAERDLQLRGPGEVLGTRQTGDLSFYVADLIRDSDLLPKVHEAADMMLRDHPELITPLIDRWLGVKAEYGKV